MTVPTPARATTHKVSVLQGTENLDANRIAAIKHSTNERIRLGVGDLGRGVFAKRKILKWEAILVFEGPIIGGATARAKGEKECWPLQIGLDEYIDLVSPGCFANHACDPNSGVRNDRILVAIRDIGEGEEIRYDYSTTVDEDFWCMSCQCKSSHCRSEIADFKYLKPALQEYYLSIGIVQDFIAKSRRRA